VVGELDQGGGKVAGDLGCYADRLARAEVEPPPAQVGERERVPALVDDVIPQPGSA